MFKSFHKIAEETFPDYIDYPFLSLSINQENSQMALFHTFLKIKKIKKFSRRAYFLGNHDNLNTKWWNRVSLFLVTRLEKNTQDFQKKKFYTECFFPKIIYPITIFAAYYYSLCFPSILLSLHRIKCRNNLNWKSDSISSLSGKRLARGVHTWERPWFTVVRGCSHLRITVARDDNTWE